MSIVRARRAEAGTALKEDQPRQIGLRFVQRHDFARKHGQARAVGLRMIDRDLEFVIGEHQTGNAMSDGHLVDPSYVLT